MSGLSLAGLAILAMFVLMALRTPIAIAMFIAGSGAYVIQTGWAPYANFMNSMAFARFASYDLGPHGKLQGARVYDSVVPPEID